jgi:glycopeptide antibiotics resistance protein
MTRRASGLLMVVCLLGVGVIALAPFASELNRLTVRLWQFFGTTVPLAPAWATPEDYGKLLNIAFFVPLAAALVWFLGDRWGWALPLCVALSVGIEVLQRFPGLGRESSAEDVACNSVGAMVGVVLAAGMIEWRQAQGRSQARNRVTTGARE